RGGDLGRLVVVDPVADVLEPGGGEVIGRLERLRQAGPEPADGALAGEFLDRVERSADHAALVFLAVDRPLLVAVSHAFPARLAASLRDARIVDADARVDRDGRADLQPPVELLEAAEADAHPVLVPAPVGQIP